MKLNYIKFKAFFFFSNKLPRIFFFAFYYYSYQTLQVQGLYVVVFIYIRVQHVKYFKFKFDMTN